MELDSRTVYVLTTASLAITAVIVASAARFYGPDLSAVGRRWALTVALSAFGFGCIAARGFVPDALSILAGHASAVAGAAVFADACARFHRRVTGAVWIWAPTAAALASSSWFYLGRPNYAARMAVFSLLMALLLARSADLLVRHRTSELRSVRLVAVGFALAATLMLLRAASSLTLDPHTAPRAIFRPGAIEQVAILGVFLCYFGLSFSFVVISNERLNDDLRRLAALDALTGLYNRRTIEELARHEVARARRSDAPLALALVDLDHFKEINDERGHLAGDAALRAVAALLEGALRAQDLVGRYGGDEFLLLMPATDVAQGTAALQRMSSALTGTPIDVGEAPSLRLTLSIGIAGAAGADADLASLLRAADEALYDAKRQGRNALFARELGAAPQAALI